MDDPIRIRGARQHNLKGLDLDLPRDALTIITGPSGSGKSSLALDTLFAAGQRRYVEALSTYAKQFLDRLEKPDVDSIRGLSPAIAIEQRRPAAGSRSTVGTATEIYDFLRLLYARVGRTYCPECGDEVRPGTVSRAVDRVAAMPPGERVMLAFPLYRGAQVSCQTLVKNLRAMGFVRVLADGVMVDVTRGAGEPGADASPLEGSRGLCRELPGTAREVMVVVDRVKVPDVPSDEWLGRLADSLSTCYREGEGEAAIIPGGSLADPAGWHRFSERFRCPRHRKTTFLDLDPRLFSFNSPYGSCPACTGFGATLEYDPLLVVPNEKRSLEQGAVDPWAKPRYVRERSALRRFATQAGVSGHTPWNALPKSFRNSVLYGSGNFPGVMEFLVSEEPKRYKQYIRIFLRRYQSARPCRQCDGTRLRAEARYVKINDADISTVGALPVRELAAWLAGLDLRPKEATIAATILRELNARVGFLVDVGLGYLALNRLMRTLSGGEAQRIALANSLGTRLVDTLYVLDEPSIGLHPCDVGAIMAFLQRLRDTGNTVVVVEHNADAIRSADHVVELGPGSGEAGGEVVFQGTPARLASAPTVTGRYLAGGTGPRVATKRRPVAGRRLKLRGATLHNLRGVDAEFPVGAVTVVTGVSGSGKSTLVRDILYRALENALGDGEVSARRHLGELVGSYRVLEGLEHVNEVVLIDQNPIGRSSRSNPVTYIKAWDEIRRIFARQPDAKAMGLEARHFSFNVKGGRCEACKGAGYVQVEMVFMADIHVLCDVCGGKRYRPHVLQVKIRERNVSKVLDLTVDGALRFFLRERRLGRILWHLQQVGLGYLRLGQPAPTLSGGEAQRLKIARELAGASGRRTGPKVYLLDEPTTGLSGQDVAQLNDVLQRLVEGGNTVIVVEHDLDVVQGADWVIDLGPGAGEQGGEVVATGRPEDVANVPESVTGRYLRTVLGRAGAGA